jgi:hypothetical protein
MANGSNGRASIGAGQPIGAGDFESLMRKPMPPGQHIRPVRLCAFLSKVQSVDQRMRRNAVSAFANCGGAVAHVRGRYGTHAPLVWAQSVYFAGLSFGLIVLPLSSRVIGREISRASFKLSDCALGESWIAVQIVGIQGLDHDPRSILSLCASCCLWSSSLDILLVVTDTAS